MSQLVTITSITANTPVDIYYCNSFSASCVFVSTVSVFPYQFNVPSPYDETDFVVKIIDTQGCNVGDMVYITPTPTSSVTPTMTQTPTGTVTQTPTQTGTPTQTPTNTGTPTNTPTNTITPTQTPAVASHFIGQNSFITSGDVCTDTVTILPYYTYLSEANTVPVSGATVYQTLVNGVLYNPFNGGGKFYKMGFGLYYYWIQIDVNGEILSFGICENSVTPTPTTTNTPTNTQTNTTTNTVTPTNTPTNTQTSTQTPTLTSTPTYTPTNSVTPTNTPTHTKTPTLTPTQTSTLPVYGCITFSGIPTTIQLASPIINPDYVNYPSSEITVGTSYANAVSLGIVNSSYIVNNFWTNYTNYEVTFTISGTTYGPYIYQWGANSTGYVNVTRGTFNANSTSNVGSTYFIQFSSYDYNGNNLSSIIQSFSLGDVIEIHKCQGIAPTPTPTTTNTNTPTNTPTNTSTETPTGTPTPTPTSGYTNGGWFFYSADNASVASPPSNNGNIAFITGSTGTYSPNYSGGSLALYFNVNDSVGTSHLSEFSVLNDSGGTITISQGGSVAIYSGTSLSYQIPSNFLVLTVNNPAQMIQSASTRFVSGTIINVVTN